MRRFVRSVDFRISPLILSAGASLLLSGCGVVSSTGPSISALPAMEGKVMGGETPISGANVILWQTDPSNGGYGSSGAVKLGTTTTGSGGTFRFTTGYTCAAGQFVYITATGGDVSNGSNMINNNQVQLAAVGSCANLATAAAQAKVVSVVNEASTVAAAYALANFITVVPSTTGNQLVYIGAPAANNAATGSCTGSGPAMTCVAAGLAHAFANALNLTDSTHFDGTAPSGLAYVLTPGNTQGSVPQAEIHTLANVLQSCTNTTGGAAPGGVSDGTNCGNLFAAAAPSSTNVPSDELSAIIDIAKNPKHNVSSTTCGTPPTTIFCLAPAAGAAFQPQLATAPTDWALAITYSGLNVGSSTSPFTFPSYLTLDANDNVYVLSANASSANTTAGVQAMTSAGIGLWANPQSGQFCAVGALATDTVGTVWMVNGPATAAETNGCYPGVEGFSQATGAQTYQFGPSSSVQGSTADPTHGIGTQALSLAIDNYNNVWYSRKSTNCSVCLYEFPYTAGTGGAAATYGAAAYSQGSLYNVVQMVFDSSDNLYLTNNASALEYVLKPTGTSGIPTYGNAAFSLTLSANGTGLGTLDGSNDLWVGSTAKLTEFAAPVASGETGTPYSVASATSSTTTPSTPYQGQVDGANTLWYPSRTASGQIWFTQLASNTSDYIYTCYAPAGATTCTAVTSPNPVINLPRLVQLDSTGAIWVPSQGTNYVVQILGPGAPVYPQLSYGVAGTKPH